MRKSRSTPSLLPPLQNEVGLHVTITFDFAELATFNEDQITAALDGLAKVVAAANQRQEANHA